MVFEMQIANLSIAITYDNLIYEEYLIKEYGLLSKKVEKADINIKIFSQLYNTETKERMLDFIWKTKNGGIVQKFTAFDREFWIEFLTFNEIQLYIPYSNDLYWHKFINSFYENRAVSCLGDFLHNTFIMILQMHMLKRDGALFHCSAYRDDLIRTTYILTGSGQTGKSALLKEIGKIRKIHFISEDFSFVFKQGYIYGLPHLCRVKVKNITPQLYRFKLGDFLNALVYYILKHQQNGRHFSSQDYLEIEEFLPKEKASQILFLNRNVDNLNYTKIKKDILKCRLIDIITEEFKNMVSVENLVQAMYESGLYDLDLKGIIFGISKVYEEFLEKCDCYELQLPIYPSINESANKTIAIVEGIKNDI